jgi:hypothetical protein
MAVTLTSDNHAPETMGPDHVPTSGIRNSKSNGICPPRPTVIPIKAISWSAGSEIKLHSKGPETDLDYLQLEFKHLPTNLVPRATNTETLATTTKRGPTEVRPPPPEDHMIQARTEGDTSLDDDQSPLDIHSSKETVEDKDKTPQRHARRKRKDASLRSLLWRSLKTRASYAQKRSELKESRLVMSAAEERLMKFVREMRIHNSNTYGQDQFEEYFKALQDARNAYGPIEESVEAAEDQLDKEEYEITQLQEQISAQASPLSPHLTSDISSLLSDDSDSVLYSPERPHDPLYDDYLSRMGDADLLREEYSELVLEHDRLQESHKRNQKFGLELLPEDQTTLAEFHTRQADLLEQIRIVEADIKRLRILCVQQGLLDEEVSEEEAYKGVAESEDEHLSEENGDTDILKDISGQVNEYSRFSLLLDRPCHHEDEKESKLLLTGFKDKDPGDRITRWLLHKVRASCSEVELLHRLQNEELNLPSDNTEQWQADVLGCWFSDPMNFPPSKFTVRASHTERDITPSPFVDKLTFPVDSNLADKVMESKDISINHHIAILRLDFGLQLRVDDKPTGKSWNSI